METAKSDDQHLEYLKSLPPDELIRMLREKNKMIKRAGKTGQIPDRIATYRNEASLISQALTAKAGPTIQAQQPDRFANLKQSLTIIRALLSRQR
ncbi:hypothetical protein A2767_00630 [Candidatus Roizmanbacteria bacterium RIFCSPHIGHO2_01_FULL_35_10]|uniref:50S ribosomal protein L29 n=1 Tax=Candidatus Roizmanbacteria bacterium RIFCSPLOWO2_01_FULL_35_13 TaxID=1802055 RepID=A0A1F7I922_9BACT|nr:MAG: hypothetical protein A2767_00630 [Candidatus Roizmanbacteria bacterium RIFCSPHIGHO2_01_FULL_35_10]OGK39844.1 MAG: hypothetical protein A3A74_03055 [Candidatus Roizmanbacteria bacterium RIFCSPLOWO2_01_FULL_35_13]